MVQVFGRRILGGIGAPGGGMSEAFGAGVNTTLNQRVARQGMDATAQEMRLRDVQAGYVAEDRETAKKQRAAAAGAAAGARAKRAAFDAELMRIYGVGGGGSGSPVAGVNMTAAPAAAPGMARDRQGPAVATPAKGRAPAGVRVAPSPPLSFSPSGGGSIADRITNIVPLSGTLPEDGAYSEATNRMMAELDALNAVPRPPSFYAPGTGDLSARPGDFAARATVERLGAPMPQGAPTSRAEVAARVGDYSNATSGMIPIMQGEQETIRKLLAVETAARQNPSFFNSLRPARDIDAMQARIAELDRNIIDARMRPGPTQLRGVGALEGPESVTAQVFPPAGTVASPAGTVAPPAATAAAAAPTAAPTVGTVEVTMPDGSKLPLSLGDSAAAPLGGSEGALGFGPKLGAMPQTQEELAVDAFVQSGYDMNAPAPPRMGEPGAPDRAITRLLVQRDQQVQLIQALIGAGRYDDARTAQADLMGIDAKTEAAVARLALNEAVMFNAPQRLSAVWSDIKGQQYEFIPAAGGGMDVFVNGEQLDAGLPMDVISEQTLLMTDGVYADQRAELAALRAESDVKNMSQAEANVYQTAQEAQIDIEKGLAVGLTEIDLMTMKQELGIGVEDKIDFQKFDDGAVLVFINGNPAGEYREVTTDLADGTQTTSFQRVQ